MTVLCSTDTILPYLLYIMEAVYSDRKKKR